MHIGVAVVDSGVHARHPHVGVVVRGRSFVPGRPVEDYIDFLGHGTAVAGAICEKTAAIELFVAKIFHQSLVTTAETLLDALDWCLDQPVSLINLSLGTTNLLHRKAFEKRVALAFQRQIRIVSPAGSLPGDIEGVVGVRLDDSIPRDQYGDRYAACGWPRPIPGRPQEQNLHGISFAVANVTGCLARDFHKKSPD